jgi:hypothetical protein
MFLQTRAELNPQSPRLQRELSPVKRERLLASALRSVAAARGGARHSPHSTPKPWVAHRQVVAEMTTALRTARKAGPPPPFSLAVSSAATASTPAGGRPPVPPKPRFSLAGSDESVTSSARSALRRPAVGPRDGPPKVLPKTLKFSLPGGSSASAEPHTPARRPAPPPTPKAAWMTDQQPQAHQTHQSHGVLRRRPWVAPPKTPRVIPSPTHTHTHTFFLFNANSSRVSDARTGTRLLQIVPSLQLTAIISLLSARQTRL